MDRPRVHRVLGAALWIVTAPAGAGLAGSKHDLLGLAPVVGKPDSTSVCVFCHTPTGRRDSGRVPMWKSDTGSPQFARYASLGSGTDEGEDDLTVGSNSLACLSCHDGTQALDVMIVTRIGPETGQTALEAVLARGKSPIAAPRHDHPVNIPYARGACTGIQTRCEPNDTEASKGFAPAEYSVINARPQWWVDVNNARVAGARGLREKTDMILYTRDFRGQNGPAVECASCHDPHNSVRQPVSFLRISNDGGEVCAACHVK